MSDRKDMKERVSWIQNGTSYKRIEGTISNVPAPPPGIYNIIFDPNEGWSLKYTEREFVFNHKIYSLETEFMDYVMKTYENTKGNMGILLNGIKGTGKTVTAKMLANRFGLPVIIAKSFHQLNPILVEYISSWNFDCVLFFDEFEKNWDSEDPTILQIMDGVYTTDKRKVFLLTTNQKHVNENLVSRPSRVRYLKEFGNITHEVIDEYLNDNLNDKSCAEKIVEYVDSLKIITIDILKCIVEDINIHGIDTFLANKVFFNVSAGMYLYRTRRMSFRNILEVEHEKYTIARFVEDIKKCDDIEEEDMPSIGFNTAFQKKMSNKLRDKLDIRTLAIRMDKPIDSLENGDHFGYSEHEYIVKIDLSKSVIVTKDETDDMIYFYYIYNTENKPSMFNKTAIDIDIR